MHFAARWMCEEGHPPIRGSINQALTRPGYSASSVFPPLRDSHPVVQRLLIDPPGGGVAGRGDGGSTTPDAIAEPLTLQEAAARIALPRPARETAASRQGETSFTHESKRMLRGYSDNAKTWPGNTPHHSSDLTPSDPHRARIVISHAWGRWSKTGGGARRCTSACRPYALTR